MVPLDAWNRMLNQLGNLHEAGRDLAEARERAARAETEAAFLRERLSDMREQLEQAEAPVEDEPSEESTAVPAGPAPAPSAAEFVRSTAAAMRERFRRR